MGAKRSLVVSMSLIWAMGCGASPEPGSSEGVPLAPDQEQASEASLEDVALQIPGRDLTQHPPNVLAIRLYPTSGVVDATARLELKIGEDLPRVLKFVWNDRVRTMRDDGLHGDRFAADRVYTALLNVDLETEGRKAAAFERLSLRDLESDDLPAGGISIPVRGQITAEMPSPRTVSALSAELAGEPGDNCGGNSCFVDAEKSLLIRDLAVVNSSRTSDPCLTPNDTAKRAWNFGYLMSQMFPSDDASRLALGWLDEWEQTRTINNQSIRAVRSVLTTPTTVYTLPGMLRKHWKAASARPDGGVSMNKAPFRLLAIVNRFDLRKNIMFGSGYAGELRFVYGVLNQWDPIKETGGGCASMDVPGARETGAREGGDDVRKPHTVILEYGVFRGDQNGVLDWAKKWHALSQLPWDGPGLSQYLTDLEAITDSVVRRNAAPTRKNGSALLRIRTNESPDNAIWDLREFEWQTATCRPANSTACLLKASTVKQTPAGFVNDSFNLGRWFSANRSFILERDFFDGRRNVPNLFPSNSGYVNPLTFSGARAVVDTTFGSAPQDGLSFAGHWKIRNMQQTAENIQARHLLSLGTCNGCHGVRETGTSFAHVQARHRNEPSVLSTFLTGYDPNTSEPVFVPDPVAPEVTRFFHDLQARNEDMANFLFWGPTAQLSFQPSMRVH
jgi:hypothetical protein